MGRRLDGFNELDVDLDPVPGQLLLVAFPPLVVALVALGGRQEQLSKPVDERS